MTVYVQLALYPDPDEHFAYVSYVEPELSWQSGLYAIHCPADGCRYKADTLYPVFSQAWDAALAHRRELLDDWLQPGIDA